MCEVELWRGVLASAANDAYINRSNGLQKNAAWHVRWCRTRDCALICDYANVDYDAVKDGFKRIYEGDQRKPNGKTIKAMFKKRCA